MMLRCSYIIPRELTPHLIGAYMRPFPATSVPINGRGFCESGVCVCVLNNSPENVVDLVDL